MTGSDGRTVPLNEPGTVVVWRRNRSAWQEVRTLAFALDEGQGLAGLRRTMAELIAFLENCRTLVAVSASGAAFFELGKARCQVFEIRGAPGDFLDSVWREAKAEEEASVPPSAGVNIPAPAETVPGKFTISIKDIQGKRPEVSSKQVLQQFIRRGGFSELAITCDHLPPWIEVEAERLGISVDAEYRAPHELLVILRKPRDRACCLAGPVQRGLCPGNVPPDG
jgi:Fe-only nitrogenase accessory protein AnfO